MIHQITKTENYLVVVDDSEIKEDDWYKTPLGIYSQFNGTEKLLEGTKRVAAHLPLNGSPILEGVDLLPEINEINKELIFKTIGGRYGLESIQEHDQVDGYFDTYKEAEIALIKKIIEFECEIVWTNSYGSEVSVNSYDVQSLKPKTITTAQGIQWVGKYRLI